MKKSIISIILMCVLGAANTLSAKTYTKVTTTPADWSGTYLIVCESQQKAYSGEDVVGGNVDVTIADGRIVSDDLSAYEVEIAPADVAGRYSIRIIEGANGTNRGLYLSGPSDSSNGSSFEPSVTTGCRHSLSLDGTDVDIVSDKGPHFRYNKASNQGRFRFFKSSTYTAQAPVALFRLEADTPPAPEKLVPNIGFAPLTVVVPRGASFSAPVLANPVALAPVDYTSDNPAVAMVSGESVVLSGALGEATITASFAGSDSFLPTSASYVVSVVATSVLNGIPTGDTDAPAYNILGQPVGPDYKGFVIKGGHKLLQR